MDDDDPYADYDRRAVSWACRTVLISSVLSLAFSAPRLGAIEPQLEEASTSSSTARLLPPSTTEVGEPALRAIDAGLRYLLDAQDAGTGRLGSAYPVATTALGGLAVLGAGIQPDQPPFDRFLARAVAYLLDRSDAGGGYVSENSGSADTDSGSRMHGHCYAILFFTQVSGTFPLDTERRIQRAIDRGVRVIERSQSRRGGWWYGAVNHGNQDEASVTICAVQALRAARNIGYDVNPAKIEWGIRYVRDCQLADGSIRYSLSLEDPRSSFALTAAAAATLNAAGVYRRVGGPDTTSGGRGSSRSDEVVLRRALDFLRRDLGENDAHPERAVADEFFYYGNLYAGQAFYQEGGALWSDWYPKVRENLLRPKLMVRRGNRASWRTPEGESRYGSEYATAMALLILEMPLGYLPIFQR